MICALAASPPVDAGADMVDMVDEVDARFWLVLRSAGLVGPGGRELLVEEAAEPVPEPAEVRARPDPPGFVAVDHRRSRHPPTVREPPAAPGQSADPDGDGRLSRQRSPPAVAAGTGDRRARG